MKLFAKILSTAALLAVAAPFALADNITGTINGYGTYAPAGNGVQSSFTYTPTTPPNMPTDTATFNGVAFSATQMTYFTVNTTGSNPGKLFTFTNGANTVTFNTTSVQSVTLGGGVTYLYSGTLTGTLNGTAVSSAFQEQFGTSASGGSTAYATVAPTPEPSSLALLGTGLAGVGSLVRRRIKRA